MDAQFVLDLWFLTKEDCYHQKSKLTSRKFSMRQQSVIQQYAKKKSVLDAPTVKFTLQDNFATGVNE